MNYSSLYPPIWTINQLIVFRLLHSYDILARFEKSRYLIG